MRVELRNLGFPIDLCGVSALAAGAPEGSAADAPPDTGSAADAPPGVGDVEHPVEIESRDDSEGEVPGRVMKLRDQVMTIEHRLFHFPKNPFCDVCNQARMLSRRVRRKPRDPDEEPDPLEASEFGEVIDHIHVFRSRCS